MKATGYRKIAGLTVLAVLCRLPINAGTLGWYNGDPVNNFSVGIDNGINTVVAPAMVFDDFVVPAGGWTVTGVFSDNQMNFTGVTQAEWEIRSGVSVGNGGTLVASGTSTASQTSLGLSGNGLTIYQIEVNNLNVSLAAGKYWLSVAPVGFGPADQSSSAFTVGANAVGTPPGNDQDSFTNIPSLGLNYCGCTSAGQVRDWSMGVIIASPTATPEPGTLGGAGGAAALFAWALRMRRSRTA
jgi:hypothetical protein